MSWLNAGVPGRLAIRTPSAVTLSDAEFAVGSFTQTSRVVAAYFVPDANIVTDASHGFVLNIAIRDKTGSQVAVAASYTQAAAKTASAFVPVALNVVGSLSRVEAGYVISFQEKVAGTGTAMAAGALLLEYTDQ